MRPDTLKVLIYATLRGRLLVFDEPDFPDVRLQVPGGTVEPGEDVAQAAAREFAEETGLSASGPLTLLDAHEYRFVRNGADILHRRHYFHIALSGDHRESWIHHEMTPFDGGDPILFNFFWMDIEEARQKLGYGMGDCLGLLL